MLDFTSVLYLGFRHDSRSVHPWSQMTTGVPTAMAEPKVGLRVAGRLAQLQGCEQAVVGPSTLHLFWDLFTQLAERPFAIFLDRGTYPIAQWGVERAELRGIPVYRFPHQDVPALSKMIKRMARKYRPLIVSDGLCSSCGCSAPLRAYFELVKTYNGLLVMDDTQALGLLGFSPNRTAPYGHFGGGSLPHQAISGPEVIVISSLAKAFGVPVAVLAGSHRVVDSFQKHSETRVHCSPPSFATLHAAERALNVNERDGDRRRYQLAQNVTCFRHLLAQKHCFTGGRYFPVQTLRLPPGTDVVHYYKTLEAKGVRSVLRRGCNGRPAISIVITARHRPVDIEQAVTKITACI